jgi:hypothetical protein
MDRWWPIQQHWRMNLNLASLEKKKRKKKKYEAED